MSPCVWIMVFSTFAASLVNGQVTSTFKNQLRIGQLRNFVFDPHTNSLYVGGINTLYWLSSDLKLLDSLELGPLNDHVNCSVNLQDDCTHSREPMPAVNQALIIDAKNRVLIACSVLYHGSCQTIDIRRFVPLNYFYKPVVSNDPNGSTVMFVGSGIEAGGVLYVGTSFSSIGLWSYRNSVALISVRNLFSLDLSWRSSTASSSISLLERFRTSFPVDFAGAFEHEHYVYFFVNHPDSLLSSGQKSSYVMRICKNDTKLQSFIEVPIECKIGGMIYRYMRDVTNSSLGKRFSGTSKENSGAVYGAFTVDNDGKSKESAVCVYSMEEIETKFLETVQSCYNGGYFTGPAFITKQTLCVRKNTQVKRDFCADQSSSNHPLAGNSPIQPVSTAAIRNTVASAILVKTAGSEIVIYVGSQNGTVLKLELKSKENLSPVFDVLKLKQDVLQPVKDLILGYNNNVYALTDDAIYSFKAYDCESANTCNKCLRDPHCGWCTVSKRCGSKSACSSALMYLTDQCPLIVGFSQSQISYDKYSSTKFVVTNSFLPTSYKRMECKMENQLLGISELSNAALIPTDTVTCMPFRDVPKIPSDKTHISLSLSVLIDEVTWVTTSVNLYNCGHLSTCASCTSTTFSCKWCTSRHRCMSALDDCSTIPQILVSIDRNSKCPRVEFTPDKSSALMASGTRRSFAVVGINILKIYSDKLKCRFKIGDQSVKTHASFKSTEPVVAKTTITCDPLELDYSAALPNISVPFDIIWENDLPLDNSNGLQVYLYKCRYLASTCGHCMTMDMDYRCGWCGDHCSLQKDCHQPWTYRNQTCPNPQITYFSPPGGPVRGGTRLSIRGLNLGMASSELDVIVAGQKCFTIPESYVPSESFTCITGSVGQSTSGPIIINIKGQLTTSSRLHYQYKDPVILGFNPRRGPCSGGTLLQLNGTNLDYGSTLTVMLNQRRAQILSRNSSQITCITPQQFLPLSVLAKLTADNSDEIATRDHYIYIENPNVNTVDPKISLVSGGSLVDVRGINLNSVQRPLLIVYIGAENKTAPCKLSGTSFLQCLTPDLRDFDHIIDQEMQLDFGLVMDNVTKLLNIPDFKSSIKLFTYFPLPSIRHFTTPIQYKRGELITIQGENVAILGKFRDLSIMVGGIKCDPVGSNDLQLAFHPPENQVLARSGYASVVISVGNYNETIGYVDYTIFPLRLLLGVVLGVGLTLVAFVLFLVVCLSCKRKRIAGCKKAAPNLRDLESKHERAYGNSYSENAPCSAEAIPLKSSKNEPKDIGEDDVQDDSIDEKGGELYFQNLVKKINNRALQKAAKEIFISRERIDLADILGRGHFGQVFAATLWDENLKNPVSVAVKTVEDTSVNPQVVERFLKEGMTMKKFDHPHVLGLCGISLGLKKEPMVILPFMTNGDLRSYVRDRSKEFTARQLLNLAQQVAEGMAYLSSLNFIHRDLAARNCMIDEKNQVKVADFGLSHELYDREYYSSKDRRARLPIKWMALESLEDFIFTTKSDVWSFGVLMWELMTRGITPYPDVEIFETRNYLASGRRLRKPKYCHDDIYNIMLECWSNVPERRPSFGGLVNRIEVLVNPSQPLQQRDDGPTYNNITGQDSGEYLKPTQLTDSCDNVSAFGES